MTTTQQKAYLLTETQREALLSYLQERPFKEVANGIQFLLNAPTVTLNIQEEGNGQEKDNNLTLDIPENSEEFSSESENFDLSVEAPN